jgi:MFS transporter, MHS family, proline/betaine transporter
MLQEKTQTKLTKEQRDTIAILSIGAFLEHFDRMLHIHTTVLLNELFFPKTDPLVTNLLLSFSFCASYLLTPIGALFLGHIGDSFGRKNVTILNTSTTAVCCLIVATLPTYEQIGIGAPVMLIMIRMIQGMSAFAELSGVEIYLTESIKPPKQYPIVALVPAFNRFGSTAAIGIAAFFSNEMLPQAWGQYGWRSAFMLGALIGVLGVIARTSLKEAQEFVDKQTLLKETFKKADIEWSNENPSINPKIPFATSLAYFVLCCARPLWFYLIFLHSSTILKQVFSFTPAQIAKNNFLPSVFNVLMPLLIAYCSYKMSPFKIIKLRLILGSTCIACFPFFIDTFPCAKTVLFFQYMFLAVRFDYTPAAPIFFKYFPALKRFRYISFINSLATLLTYLLTSFGLAFFTKYFTQGLSILFIFVPFSLCFTWAIRYFEKKEEKSKQAFASRKSTFSIN